MKPILKTIVATIVGLIAGNLVNMGLVALGGDLIPPPAGADVNTVEGLKAAMHLFEPKHFVFPFLAHALGTFVGAYLAARMAAHKIIAAMVIGIFFLIGGIIMVVSLPSPIWFTVVDLVGAYLPVAYFAGRIAK